MEQVNDVKQRFNKTIPSSSDYVVTTYKRTGSRCQRPEKEVPGRRHAAVGESVGDMQAAPARYVSVSELYSTDEVELLLDEIRELEPTSCRGEDVQDFEIAGSGCDGCAGGHSPAATDLTERSWDSHAQYRRAAPPRPQPLAPVYCRLRYLTELRGAFTLLIVLCSVCACACVWAAAGLRWGRLPRAGAVRLLLLGALSSAPVHGALLAVHVTRLDRLLPLDWRRLHALAALWSLGSLAPGAALTLAAVLAAPEYRPAPPRLAALLLAAAGVGACGALCAAVVLGQAAARWWRWPRAYRAVPPPPADRDPPL